jgi:hypothetical protein
LKVERFQCSLFEILQHLGPERFPFAHDDAGAMGPGFFRQRTDRNAAHDHRRSPGGINVGNLVSFLQLGRERAQGHQIELGQGARGPQLVDFAIFNFESFRRQPRQGQQPEAGQGSDDAIAIDKAGQGQTELGQFGIMSAHAAHGDESDFHRAEVPP